MVYNTIIMLAMGIELDNKSDLEFEKHGVKIRYKITGDDFFRFKAAKKLYDQGTRRILLVGGFVKGTDEISKPDIMEDILTRKYGIPQMCLVKIVSEANTKGNAEAVKEYIFNNKIIDNLGLLTNYYHMIRALRDFVDIHELRFIPIIAEGLVYDEEFDNIRKFYKDCGFNKIIGESKDQNSEIKGLHDKEYNRYKSGTS